MRAQLDSLGVGARLAAFAIALTLVGGAAAAMGSASGLEPENEAPARMALP